MALLTLTRPPTERQLALFDLWLDSTDRVLIREDARAMVWRPNPTRALGCVRDSDVRALGGRPHPDWRIITDDDWVKLTADHQPIINW